MSESVALVAVASPSYLGFTQDLMASAHEHISGAFTTHVLVGLEGWPVGTECRHGIFADFLERSDYAVAFLLDADLLIEEPFALAAILPPAPGIVATLHPGYVGKTRDWFPYEDRPESRAFVPEGIGDRYYAGGVIGGTREKMVAFSRAVDLMIREERADGRELRWHDESAANRLLAETPPTLTLDPGFAHPDADTYYRECVWSGRDYARHIVALDKSPAERVGR